MKTGIIIFSVLVIWAVLSIVASSINKKSEPEKPDDTDEHWHI